MLQVRPGLLQHAVCRHSSDPQNRSKNSLISLLANSFTSVGTCTTQLEVLYLDHIKYLALTIKAVANVTICPTFTGAQSYITVFVSSLILSGYGLSVCVSLFLFPNYSHANTTKYILYIFSFIMSLSSTVACFSHL